MKSSFVATLMAAIHQTVNMAKKEQMTFMEYGK